MPTTEQDYAAVEAARNKISNLTQQAGQEEAGAMTFRDDVMARVRDARAARGITNLQTDFGRATEQLSGGRQQIVDRNKGVLNPLDISNITEQQRAQALGTLNTLSRYDAENTGTIENIIGAGANKVQARALLLKSQADAAQSELQSLMQIIQMKQAEAQKALDNLFREREFTESVRQFDNKNTGGGGGGGIDFNQNQNKAPKPSFKPIASFASPQSSAPKGVIRGNFYSTGGAWIPIVQ